MIKKGIAIEAVADFFVILFLYTGISKLIDYSVFREQIAQSPVLEPISAWIAWLLPATEIAASALLFVPVWRLKGLYAALGLMILFTGYIVAIMTLSKHLPCSCGGIIEILSWKEHLVFNIVCTGLAITGVVLARRLSGRHMAHSLTN
jgi:uncharacterized membrane protein YphA (DoxX/SURF4 family)